MGHRWQPGESGNPAGRPKGTLSLMSLLKNVLQEENPSDKKTYAESLIRKYIEKALDDNDGQAVRDLIDRIDGRAKQHIEMSNAKDAEWLDLAKDIYGYSQPEAETDNQTEPEGSTEDNDS